MNAKRLLQTLEEKDMDRRDFLRYAGAAVLGIVSAKTALGLIIPEEMTKLPAQQAPQANAGGGFGRSKYGA